MKFSRRLLSIAAIVIVLAFVVLWRWLAAPSPAPDRGPPAAIVARGRIEPRNRVVAISGPADSGIIEKLLVDQGDKVAAGQVLAVLESFDMRRAEFAAAEASLRLAELHRVQVQAGAKQAEIGAQKNVIVAKEAQLLRLQNEWTRRDSLYRSTVISIQEFDAIQADLDQARSELQQAKHILQSLTEVRPVDDQVAAAQIEVARADVGRAAAAMKRLQIRAPVAGTVLSIQARAGEAIPADGILRMGDLTNLIAVAEVDQSDAARVTVGMKAGITGDVISGSIDGRVTRIAYEVFRQRRPASDILVGRDARIVEVEVTPDKPLPMSIGGEIVVQLFSGPGDKP